MTESIWVLRDPSGNMKVDGRTKYKALTNADAVIPEETRLLLVGAVLGSCAERFTANGYTLALESHARPEGVADV